jgi:hypothetical protein
MKESGMREALKQTDKGVLITLEVTPNSKQTEIPAGYNEWRKSVVVRVKSPPSRGKANSEIVKVMEKLFGRKVEIVKGVTSSHKQVIVYSTTIDEVLEKLEEAGKGKLKESEGKK